MSLVEQKIDEKLLNITHTELSELQENTIEDWHKYLTVIKRCPVAGKLRLSKNI